MSRVKKFAFLSAILVLSLIIISGFSPFTLGQAAANPAPFVKAPGTVPIVEATVTNTAELNALYTNGFDVLKYEFDGDECYVTIMVHDNELDYFEANNIYYQVIDDRAWMLDGPEYTGPSYLTQNVQRASVSLNADLEPIPGMPENPNATDRTEGAPYAQPNLTIVTDGMFNPTGISFNQTWGFPDRLGYRTVSEYYAEMNYLAQAYPHLVKLHEYGTSFEGVPLRALEISNNPGGNDGRPATMHQASNHAREWGTSELCMNLAWNLITKYGVDDEVTELLDTTTCWFLPMTNPDGVHWDQRNSPGSWRYNRSTYYRELHGGNAIGVDLNRNYAYGWGSDNGSSAAYRGIAPLSEPEIFGVSEVLRSNMILSSISGHTFPSGNGQLVVFPWAFVLNVDSEGKDNPLQITETANIKQIARRQANYNLHSDEYTNGMYAYSGESLDYGFGALRGLAFLYEYGRYLTPKYMGNDQHTATTNYKSAYGKQREFLVTYPTTADTAAAGAPQTDLTAEVVFLNAPYDSYYGPPQGRVQFTTAAQVQELGDLTGKILVCSKADTNNNTAAIVLAAQAKGAVGVLMCSANAAGTGAFAGTYTHGYAYAHYLPNMGNGTQAGVNVPSEIKIPVAGTSKPYLREMYEKSLEGPVQLTLKSTKTPGLESLVWNYERNIGAYMENMSFATEFASHITGTIKDSEGNLIPEATLTLKKEVANPLVQGNANGVELPHLIVQSGELKQQQTAVYEVNGGEYDWSVTPSEQVANPLTGSSAIPIIDEGYTITVSAPGKKAVTIENVKVPEYQMTVELNIVMEDSKDVVFYDEDGTTVLGSIPIVAVPNATGKFYIDWKQLNNVPDYNAADDKIILAWKVKGGADTRYSLSDIAARSAVVAADIARERLIPLTGGIELVPLTTMPKSAFDDIHYGSMVVDGHMDAPMRIVTSSTDWRPAENNDLSVVVGRGNTSQALYPWMLQGGMSGGLFAAYTGGYVSQDFVRGSGDRANSRILSLLNATHWSADRNPEYLSLVLDANGFATAFAADKLGIMQSIEGAYSITPENCEELIEQYYDLGVRVISFTWNSNSYLAAGNLMADPSPYNSNTWSGMSELGKRALAKMDELGIVYDVSHSDDKTVNDALAATSNPIIASHSGAREVYDNLRNLWDPEIIAIAKRGGAIFQNFYGDFIEEPRSVSEVVDQIDHIRDLLTAEGLDWSNHVCFGSDYDGGTNVADINDARFYYRITKEMLARGYTAEELAKVSGTNAFRIMNEVQGNATADHRGGTAVISSPTANGVVLGWGLTYAQLNTREPSFSANVMGAESARVIVDGIVYPANVSGGTLTASLAGTPLQEAFHAVTFEATDASGKVSRNTKIFFVGEVPEVHKVEFMAADGSTPIRTVYVNNNGTINEDDVPEISTNGRQIIGWRDLRATADFNFATTLTRSYRLVAIEDGEVVEPNLQLTTEAKDVKAGDEFTLTTSFKEPVNSNAAVLNFTFATDKFEYVDFTPFEGVDLLEKRDTDTGVQITVMVLDYNTTTYGDLTLKAKEGVILSDEENEVKVLAQYVVKPETGDKHIVTEEASTVFNTIVIVDPPIIVYDLLTLSDMIDAFGLTSEDPNWDKIKIFDLIADGQINIDDVALFASKIGKE